MQSFSILFFSLHTKYGSLQQLKFKFSRRYFSHTVLKRIFRNKQLFYPYLRKKNVLCLSCAFTCFQLGYLSEFELNPKILKNLSNPMSFLKCHITSSPALLSSIRNLYKKEHVWGKSQNRIFNTKFNIYVFFLVIIKTRAIWVISR